MPLPLSTCYPQQHYHYNYHLPLLLKPPFLLPHKHKHKQKHPFLLLLHPPPEPLRASTSPTNPTVPSTASLPHSSIQRIADKLRSLGIHDSPQTPTPTPGPDLDSPGDIFLPSPRQLPSHRVGHTLDPCWSTKERRVEKVEEPPTLAELTLSKPDIRRLTTIGLRMKQKIKVGKAGVTEGVVNGIHERWRKAEVVKIVCDDLCRVNLKRTHHLLERKTGGVVVWRCGTKIILYRGANYKYPYFSLDEASSSSSSQNAMDSGDQRIQEGSLSPEMHIVETAGENSRGTLDQSSLIQGVGSSSRVRFLLPGEKQLIEEADKLLEGLGPRFTDWWGYDPLPVDADLLPAVVPDYRKPFRLLPYGVKPKLTNDELTVLKRLGRPLPCHFALGRNGKHQGLATAILKLWEKCEIAKIAVKRGVQNTISRLMAEELKRLTGGILLSRDKECFVLYRGKDFLPSAVSSAIEERRKSRVYRDKQLIDVSLTLPAEYPTPSGEGHVSVSKSEEVSRVKKVDCTQEQKTKSIEAAITRTSRNLSKALEEKAKAEKLLSDLEEAEISRQAEVDKEGITEEERYMLRRVGLKMKPFLLLGRRGVFDGTIENMHLHWKYRELVKIICGGGNIDEIHNVARLLEAESGGILVAVERVRKGFAVIVYRGKNYQRPSNLRPQTLLNKKAALKRSIEAQRRKSLKLNVLKLTGRIEELRSKLVEDQEALDMHTTDEQLKFQLKGLEEHDLKPTISSDSTDPQEGSMSSIQQEKLVNAPALYQETHETTEQCPSGSADGEMNPNSVLKEKTSRVPYIADVDHVVATFSKTNHVAPDDSGSASRDKLLVHSTSRVTKPLTGPVSEGSEHHPFETGARNMPEKELAPPVHRTSERDSSVVSTIARPLTKKERLLLRRQALKLKNRPVLAVGKSNVITGIAKTIKEHFKKHALAIVNVKGRAEGTSVQEVVFQLEQATGGVLVSQEPSKIILYRGWGGGVDILHGESDHHDKQAAAASMAVSPELVKAMRLECGLSID